MATEALHSVPRLLNLPWPDPCSPFPGARLSTIGTASPTPVWHLRCRLPTSYESVKRFVAGTYLRGHASLVLSDGESSARSAVHEVRHASGMQPHPPPSHLPAQCMLLPCLLSLVPPRLAADGGRGVSAGGGDEAAAQDAGRQTAA